MNTERLKAILTIIVTAVVNILNVYGYAVDADMWVNVALSIVSAITIIYAWWKNQNVTEQAQAAQLFLNDLKARKDETGVAEGAPSDFDGGE